MGASTRDLKKFEDGTMGPSMSTGEDGKWKKNTTGWLSRILLQR
jgi:hypothetical protein